MNAVFHGVVPALLTPFRNDQVDTAALRRLVDFLVDHGVHGLYPNGTTGEGMLMNAAERMLVAETVVETVRGRVPVMVHVGSFSTSETIALARHAKSIGADAIGVVSPYFYSLDKESMFQHYLRVAESVPDLPVYIYNIPGNTRNDVSPDLAKRIAEACPNVVGVKDSSKDVARLEAYIEALGSDYTVLVGSDALILPSLAVGGAGVISAVANVFPREVVAVYDAYCNGDLTTAKMQQYKVNRLRDILKQGPYLASFKAALEMRGIQFGGMKSPLRELSDEQRAKLRADLEAEGVLF